MMSRVIDTSESCDVCKMKSLCQRYKKILDFEGLIDSSEVRGGNNGYWPMRTYVNDFKIKHACDYFTPN